MKWNIIAVSGINKSTVWELWIDGWKRSVHQTWHLADLARKQYKRNLV